MTAAVYQPQGAFDIENATRLLAEGAKRIGQNRVLTIDCAGLRACDSAAVATLLEWRQIGAKAGLRIVVRQFARPRASIGAPLRRGSAHRFRAVAVILPPSAVSPARANPLLDFADLPDFSRIAPAHAAAAIDFRVRAGAGGDGGGLRIDEAADLG